MKMAVVGCDRHSAPKLNGDMWLPVKVVGASISDAVNQNSAFVFDERQGGFPCGLIAVQFLLSLQGHEAHINVLSGALPG